jgi:hypothetical protein
MLNCRFASLYIPSNNFTTNSISDSSIVQLHPSRYNSDIIMSLLKKITTATHLYTHAYLFRTEPVLVYAPGRVGSISMIQALQSAGIFSIKVEWLDYKTRGTVRFCKKHIVDERKPAKVITLVRDPVEIVSSLFFSKASRGHLPLGHQAIQAYDLAQLQKAFETEMLNSELLPAHLYWYEQEFQPHLGVDVFSHPFDTEKKHGLIADDTYPTLILRTDLPDGDKEQQVKDFLKISNFSIERLNVKAARNKGDLYREFTSQLTVPKTWLDTIYSSPYAQHFFSQQEITDAKQRYGQ